MVAGALWVFWPGAGRNFSEVSISEGDNAYQISRSLMDAGLIRSRYPFLIWIKVRNAGLKLQIGRYRMSDGRSAFWIVDDMIRGRVMKMKLTIPEGYAHWQIAERLNELKICDGDEFKKIVTAKKLEGFLFPATYEMTNGLAPATVANILVTRFNQRWTPDIENRARDVGMTKLQVVTMASIVEREVRVREELPLVAAVYLNRIRQHMRLQADPTVQYAFGYWKTRLTYDDYYNTKSPYNTYLIDGYPPGPICSPGFDAIKAVLWPAETDALYFVAQGDGRHTFSKTYREHTNKVNKRNAVRKGKK